MAAMWALRSSQGTTAVPAVRPVVHPGDVDDDEDWIADAMA